MIKKETLFKDWGGEWNSGVVDYQHFQAPTNLLIENSLAKEDKEYWQYIKTLQKAELMGL
jgi:predicted transcriptional regulator